MLSKRDILNINNIVYKAGSAVLEIYDTDFESSDDDMGF